MKIAFINIYQDVVERGAEIYVSEVSKRLSKSNEVRVLSFSQKTKPRWPLVWRAYLDPHGFQTFWCTLKVIPTLFKERFDAVIPVNGGWQPALVRLVTWIYGGKMIISGQSGIGWDDRNNLWCFPDSFVALTEYAGKWARRVNPFVKVKVIANGVDYQRFAKEELKLRFDLERPVILCVGALTESKRQDLAIKAVSKLKRGSLLLVGKGSNEKYLQDLGDRFLKNRFKIVSFNHRDMPKVYKSADLFTYPTSPSESFGIVMVEAMASGLAIVANDDPIRREIVGKAGVFVDPTNLDKYSQALGNALETVWGDRPEKQAGKFDWDRIASEYGKLITDLIK